MDYGTKSGLQTIELRSILIMRRQEGAAADDGAQIHMDCETPQGLLWQPTELESLWIVGRQTGVLWQPTDPRSRWILRCRKWAAPNDRAQIYMGRKKGAAVYDRLQIHMDSETPKREPCQTIELRSICIMGRPSGAPADDIAQIHMDLGSTKRGLR